MASNISQRYLRELNFEIGTRLSDCQIGVIIYYTTCISRVTVPGIHQCDNQIQCFLTKTNLVRSWDTVSFTVMKSHTHHAFLYVKM